MVILDLKRYDMLAMYRIMAFKYCGICTLLVWNGIFNLKNSEDEMGEKIRIYMSR